MDPAGAPREARKWVFGLMAVIYALWLAALGAMAINHARSPAPGSRAIFGAAAPNETDRPAAPPTKYILQEQP